MAEVVKNKCDIVDCKCYIRENRLKENQISLYIGEQLYFKGEICDEHRAELQGLIATNQKIISN